MYIMFNVYRSLCMRSEGVSKTLFRCNYLKLSEDQWKLSVFSPSVYCVKADFCSRRPNRISRLFVTIRMQMPMSLYLPANEHVSLHFNPNYVYFTYYINVFVYIVAVIGIMVVFFIYNFVI